MLKNCSLLSWNLHTRGQPCGDALCFLRLVPSHVLTTNPRGNTRMPRRIILNTRLSPGDLCTLTAAIQSLHDSYPGQYLTDVRTSCDALFKANPHVTKLAESNATAIDMHYTESINRSDRSPDHFLRGYCTDLGRKLGVALELQTNRPHLYLSEREKAQRPFADDAGFPADYWLVCAGIKRDFTLKQWPVEHYQAVIDHFRGKVHFVQVGSAEHDHPVLNGVTNIVGKTDTRQLMRLVYHAKGGLGPITLLQHLCAAFEKPYVALLGGREPVAWVQYPLQTTLHTLGKLPCCQTKSCWKSRVVRLNDGSEQDNSLCEDPVLDFNRPVGKCMAMIQPQEVIRAIEACYEGGALAYAGSRPATRFSVHQQRLQKAVDRPDPYTAERFAGRGVVLCAGGEKYLTCAYVCLRMLRHFGCKLPVQLWHLGASEIPDRWRPLLEELGVELVDAREVAREHPCRILAGWEIKCYALMHCRFAEVILLDADNVPLVDPEFLFETQEYRATGALFWPDRGRLARGHEIWEICGVEYRDEPEFESGQMVIDKARCWKALRVTMHFNEWSDFYYRHVHGDKETFHLAWRRLDQPYSMAPPLMDLAGGIMCHHDFSGRRIFQHRGGYKWQLDGDNPVVKGFDHHDLCVAFLADPRSKLATTVIRRSSMGSRATKKSGMTAVTVGVGPYANMARHAAEELARLTGLPTRIFGDDDFARSGLALPHYLRFRLFDLVEDEDALYFDSDMVCLNPWDPMAFRDPEAIVAVRDIISPEVVADAAACGVPVSEYFNAGLFVVNRRRHHAWLKAAEAYVAEHPRLPYYDQSALNTMRQRMGLPLRLLDRRYNWVRFGEGSLCYQVPVFMAHRLRPGSNETNMAYYNGHYDPPLDLRIAIDEPMARWLHSRRLGDVCPESGSDRVTLHEGGTLDPPGGAHEEGYWFVQMLAGGPVLTLASQHEALRQLPLRAV